MQLDWLGLVTNVIAIFSGLGLYLWISNTKWGKEHEDFSYGIMLGVILFACLVGGVLRLIVKVVQGV